jgi:hypothetical protein
VGQSVGPNTHKKSTSLKIWFEQQQPTKKFVVGIKQQQKQQEFSHSTDPHTLSVSQKWTRLFLATLTYIWSR